MRLNLIGAIVVLGATVFLAGCAEDQAPYADPTLPDNQVATLSGGSGYYVTEVDQCRVDSANLELAVVGGNKVKLTPGEHQFAVHLTMNNGNNGNQTGPTVGINNRQTWQFDYTVEAGHHYEISGTSLFNTDPVITNKETKKTEAINNTVEAIQTPEQQKRDAVKYSGD